jgi:hypothetical protein
LTFDGVYVDYDGDLSTGLNGRETPVCADQFPGQTFPINPDPDNPSAVSAKCDPDCASGAANLEDCFVTVPNDGCEWINADCEFELETNQFTGIDGKETQVHWLIGTAPPPPKMRLVASEGRVDVLWDNFSETTPDLRLNIVDFESYRIWRADNWRRPFGSDITTGPGSELWMLLAEYDQPLNRIGSDTGLDAIRYAPNIPPSAVEFYREWFEAHPFLEAPDIPGFTNAELDTAKALSQGVKYYRYTDPPFIPGGFESTVPCPDTGVCPPIVKRVGNKDLVVSARCNQRGLCQETAPSPHSGAHYFYAVSASDHKVDLNVTTGAVTLLGPGLAGDPNSNFVYINPPTNALSAARADQAQDEIYVVPNPATDQSMRSWTLQPNNDDPTGVKVEFHHLPESRGKVTVFTLSGDMVVELPFDGSNGGGSLAWDLLSRNGQEITSGVYLFSVEAEKTEFKRFVGKFVVIR